jgi:CheY-like chemotaxis protein
VQSKNHNAETGKRGVHLLSSPSNLSEGIVDRDQAATSHCRIGPAMSVHGFVGKKTEDPEVLKLLIAASEFATGAMCRFAHDGSCAPSALPHLIDRYVDIVFDLEVHFVFPNLSAEKRDLLAAILKIRNTISAVLSGALRWRSVGEKAALEQLTADLEVKFLELRSQIVESRIEAQLDPVQKKVFQDEFFSITLDKSCSTTLFFRTDVAAIRNATPLHAPPLQGKGREPQVLTQDQPELTPYLAEHRVPRRKTVLLISSDPGAQSMVHRELRQAGYYVLLANAGFSGYATAMRERPNLVIVDLSLALEISGPDACLDGRGVVKMLSKLPPSCALPFIGLISDGASEADAQVLALGARACLQKPLDPRQVLEAVQQACVEIPLETDEATPSPWTLSAAV